MSKKEENKNFGEVSNAGMVYDDSTTSTRLLQKNWSPLTVRKYQMKGWPLFIALITDANLNDLDQLIYEIHNESEKLGFVDGKIQSSRNYVGYMSDKIVDHYNNKKEGVCEGVLVAWSIDKCFISSAYGDMMTHNKCAMEVYQIINTLPHI